MAFGRQAAPSTGPEDNAVPLEEGQPILAAAAWAQDAGRRIFTCAVTVGFSTGSGLGLGGKKTTRMQRWDPATLIEAIEGLGWRLEHLDHVWEQTEHNASIGGAAIIRGLTVAHMQFRRTGGA